MKVTTDHLRYEKTGAIVTVTLDRPEKLNALTTSMHLALTAAVRRFDTEPDAWIMILRAEGRSFCAGRDIKAQAESGESPTKHSDPGITQYGLPPTDKIVITAARGHAYGAGGYYFMGGDVRVASTTLRFGLLEVPTAVLGPYWIGASERLPRPIAFRLAMGEELPLEDLVRYGLVTEVVEDEELDDAVQRWVEHLSKLPREHVLATKRLMNRVDPFQYTQLMRAAEYHTRSQLDVLDDTFEAANAFVAGRPPVFRGG